MGGRVLVTGGAGYIGSHAANALIDRGEDVTVIDRLSTGFEWLVPPAADLVVADIGDTEKLSALLNGGRFDAIMHFAGSIVVPESVADPLSYYENNTVKSRGLIECAVRAGIPHFVFSSTAAVYGSVGAEPVAEDAPLRPESPYGSSKLMTEIMLADAAKADPIRYGVLRYFNVAGADPKGRTGQSAKGATHLIKVAAEAACGKRDGIEIFGDDYPTADGTCVRDYIHVTDLVAAHLLTLDRLREGGESLTANLGYGHGFSVREVLDTVDRVAGNPIQRSMGPRRPGDAASIVADPSKARQELNWQPAHDDLTGIVEDALRWERHLQSRNRDEV
ncbi:UDP-glucose 4-epimerase GalE [Notoacmeibacter sp. MSK16QG-6]|uniref:UDP-glucose 4-epimerase GalE n=1 Tax=Notoacmeibacter sp. MSK16QG-6 TaxID=2957982 RepID=UPI0020A0368B|nr:UDP-glucose 4-epimerase GalE [Notoacmeibacter sp. MSK16QG-6]MCP1199035.1 UDP-glucose 4-epimerase GalE [Notoacmeibacter sp. MSK16QG-6]